MNQIDTKDLLSAYIAGNLGNMTTTAQKDRLSSGSRAENVKNGFDSILKESMKSNQKFERKDDIKVEEKSKHSPAIEAKRKMLKDAKQEITSIKVDKTYEKKETENDVKEEDHDVKEDHNPEKPKEINSKDKTDDVKKVDNETTDDSEKITDETADTDKKPKDESKSDEAANQLLMLLSQALNIEPKELQKMLNDSNIDLKDVIKNQKVDELGSFISNTSNAKLDKPMEKVELKEDEKENIKEILQKLKSTTDKNEVKEDESKSILQVDDKRDSQDIMRFLSEKGNKLKEQLMTKQDDVPVNEDTTKNNKEQVPEAKIFDNHKESKVKEVSPQSVLKEENNIKPMAEHVSISKENQNDKVSIQGIKESLNEKTINAEKVTEPKAITAMTNNDTGSSTKTSILSTVQKTEQPNKLFRETIVSQIVDKAKLTLTNGKSEMSLELKPEHLGRISLKISSENGTVMAKIVADNEQVKAVLESNVNMLKESLENQGIKVQGFSISLGNDKSNPNKDERQNKGDEDSGSKNSTASIGRARLSGNGAVAYNGDIIDSSVIRKYYGEKDNNINLTA